jgi:hypothetical protein
MCNGAKVGDMSNPLNQDEVDEIIETYAEFEKIKDTAEEVDRSQDTVRKYVDQAIEDEDPRLPEIQRRMRKENAEDLSDKQPGDTPFGTENETYLIEDYSGMSPGDFIKEFFEDFEVGVKGTWVEIQARRADRRQLLPTKDSLKKDLLSMKSGISKNAIMEAQYIVEEYWAEAQRFLRQTGFEAEGTPYSTGGVAGGPGPHGQPPVEGGFGQNFVGQGGGQQVGRMGQAGGQTIAALQQQLNQIQKQLNSGQGQVGDDSNSTDTLGKLRELQEEKKILEELSGGDERLDTIEQQIASLRQQVMQDPGGGQSLPPAEGENLEDRLIAMAAENPNVSFDDVFDVIDRRESQSQDPEVLEKKHEKQIKEMELEATQQRQEKIAGTLEDLFDRVGEGIGRALVADDGGEETAQGQEATADHQHEMATDGAPQQQPQPDASQMNMAQPQAQPGTQEERQCPHCDSMLVHSNGGFSCPECEYGVGQCDLCGLPVEIPPRDEARYGRCGNETCENWLDREAADDGVIKCDECGWSGSPQQLLGEGLLCQNCETIRPIRRQPDPEEAAEALDDIMES